MAEAIARDRVGEGAAVEFSSAGLYSLDGAPASPNAIAAAAEIGVDAADHRARPITRKMAEGADVIYVMTSAHRDALLAMEPELEETVELLDPDGRDITDPYGSDLDTYRAARDHIVEAIEARLEDWTG